MNRRSSNLFIINILLFISFSELRAESTILKTENLKIKLSYGDSIIIDQHLKKKYKNIYSKKKTQLISLSLFCIKTPSLKSKYNCDILKSNLLTK